MLRPYQQAAIDRALVSHKGGRKPVIVMATGCGKTHVFTEYANMASKRCMVIAERAEIVLQNYKKADAVCNDAAVEMADSWSHETTMFPPRIVSASIQTLSSRYRGGKRMHRFNWREFGLIVIDEAHHAASKRYQEFLAYVQSENPSICLLGVTATPDRRDKKSLACSFDEIAYKYEINEAVRDGWLVPIRSTMVQVDSLDFSDVRITAGDLNAGDLGRVMEFEKNLHAVATPTLEMMGGRQTVVFCTSVKQSERLAEIFNRHRPEVAAHVDGKTPPQERAEIFKRFRKGEFQILCNCNIATEGWDCPPVSCIVMARPTTSRSLYTQMVGRGTRPMVQLDNDCDSARRMQIESSMKPDCLVLDFVGNGCKHSLCSAIDVLVPDIDTRVREQVQRRLKDEDEVTEDKVRDIEADELEQWRRREITANVTYNTRNIDPFTLLGVKPQKQSAYTNNNPLTEKQQYVLHKNGVVTSNLPANQQRQALNKIFERRRKGLATLKQLALLAKRGHDQAGLMRITFEQASNLIEGKPIDTSAADRPIRHGHGEPQRDAPSPLGSQEKVEAEIPATLF